MIISPVKARDTNHSILISCDVDHPHMPKLSGTKQACRERYKGRQPRNRVIVSVKRLRGIGRAEITPEWRGY